MSAPMTPSLLSSPATRQACQRKCYIIIKLYCHIQRALYDELECSLAFTHIVPIYTIKLNMANKYKI